MYDANVISVRDEVDSCVFAKAVYLTASLFNHSCSPNCVAIFEGTRVSVRVIQPISEGVEVCISYIDQALPLDTRAEELWAKWRFVCDCPRCSSVNSLALDRVIHGIYCPSSACRSRLEGPSQSALISSAFPGTSTCVSSIDFGNTDFSSPHSGTEDRRDLNALEPLRPSRCIGCSREGFDVHLQLSFVQLAERHQVKAITRVRLSQCFAR